MCDIFNWYFCCMLFLVWAFHLYNWMKFKKIKKLHILSKSNTQITWSRQWSLRIKQTNKQTFECAPSFPPPFAFVLLHAVCTFSIYLSAIYFYTIKHNYNVNNDDNKKNCSSTESLCLIQFRCLMRLCNFGLYYPSLFLHTYK